MAKHNFKVNDIHHESVSEKFDELTEQDLDRLLKERDGFIDTDCPACLSANTSHAFEHQTLHYKRCNDCEALYISPAPSEAQHLEYVINSEAMAFWRNNMPESMRISRLPMYQERVEYALDALDRLNLEVNSVLELGAGNGEFAQALVASSHIQDVTLLEPQDLTLNDERISIIKSGFDGLEKSTKKYDAIFAWELIEHLLEPDNFLHLIKKALNPGAPIILSTPNEAGIETRMLGTNSSNILFDHVRLYNPKAIEILLKRNGFKVLEISTPGKLDAERLQRFYKEHPEKLTDKNLSFLLEDDQSKIEAFQEELVAQKKSSHMRIVAVVDEQTPIAAANSEDSKAAPATFNKVVLSHVRNFEDPYPAKLLKHILHGLVDAPKTGKLVDLGGGWGAQAVLAKQMGYDVVSVDREKAEADVESVVCDFIKEPLPFEDNSVDIIFSKSVIEHFYVHDLLKVMTEVKRVLRPGGVVIFLTPDWHSNMKEFYQIFTHVTPYTASSLGQCLRMYGFDDAKAYTFMQLPETWESPFLEKMARLLGRLPLPRKMHKWVRWSQEKMLIGYGYKPR